MTDTSKDNTEEEHQGAKPSSSGPESSPSSKGGRNAVFLSTIIGILGVFFYLASFDGPPHLPNDTNHRLKFNLDGDLLGLEIMGNDKALDDKGTPLKQDKKSIEKRTNLQCATCHGTTDQDLTNHPCHQLSSRCLPETHPPKSTCIKCHRSGKGATHVLAAPEITHNPSPQTPNPQMLKQQAADQPVIQPVTSPDSGRPETANDGGQGARTGDAGPS